MKCGDFPQDECLKICRKYKIQAGEAFLMEKSGSVVDAIQIYFDVNYIFNKINLEDIFRWCQLNISRPIVKFIIISLIYYVKIITVPRYMQNK